MRVFVHKSQNVETWLFVNDPLPPSTQSVSATGNCGFMPLGYCDHTCALCTHLEMESHQFLDTPSSINSTAPLVSETQPMSLSAPFKLSALSNIPIQRRANEACTDNDAAAEAISGGYDCGTCMSSPVFFVCESFRSFLRPSLSRLHLNCSRFSSVHSIRIRILQPIGRHL